MSDTLAPSMSTRRGESDPPVHRPPFAARRRVLVLVVLVVVAGITLAANYGPVRAYGDAKARLQQAATAVSDLEQEKTELQAQLGKLNEAGYLEGLARGELSYLKPGEELYIVTGLEGLTHQGIEDGADAGTGAGTGADQAAPATAAEEPGLFERALNAILGLF